MEKMEATWQEGMEQAAEFFARRYPLYTQIVIRKNDNLAQFWTDLHPIPTFAITIPSAQASITLEEIAHQFITALHQFQFNVQVEVEQPDQIILSLSLQ